jgi:Ferritin-like domain
LEGGGVSAYSGALQELTDDTHLTTAAVILSTEARQASWVNSAVNKQNPWSGPFDVSHLFIPRFLPDHRLAPPQTALDAREISTIASGFIVDCPSTNPPLPQPFPSLSITSTSLTPGSTVTVAFTPSSPPPAQTFLAFLTGLDTLFSPITDGKATLPALNGTVYAVVNSNNQTVTDDSIVAGPTILDFPFDSRGHLGV